MKTMKKRTQSYETTRPKPDAAPSNKPGSDLKDSAPNPPQSQQTNPTTPTAPEATNPPEEPINLHVREHETGLGPGQWMLSIGKEEIDLCLLARALTRFAGLFNGRFFDNRLRTSLITIDDEPCYVLGHYRYGRNPIGAKREINFNSNCLDRPFIDILATLLHEMDHQAQDEHPNIYGVRGRNNYHTVGFQRMTREQGIPSNKNGETDPDEFTDPFLSFCKEHGAQAVLAEYKRPRVQPSPEPPREPRGSTLKKWVCSPSCLQRGKGGAAWVASKNFNATCNVCGNSFKQVPTTPRRRMG